MKTIALYLPQFHEVEENNLWWGKGYTDWCATKKAVPLFEGHYQPHIPLNDNYYDLLDKNVMEWQAKLASEYSIDGFCFYHYWFKNGKKILEKPAEKLLEWTDIKLPFFFSWANETWARSWANIPSANTWGETFENKKDSKGRTVLLDEKYGIHSDWNDHFLYLLDFFKDNRYIKIDNKPVFMIHFSDKMPCLHQMLKCWNDLAIKNGFNGMYIICPQYTGNEKYVNATMPLANCTVWSLLKDIQYRNGIQCIPYEQSLEAYLSLKKDSKRTTLWCIQPNYDDSPRRGEKGILLDNSTPENFKHYFAKLYRKSLANDNPFIFINAWNEWGEGMHLEPDEKYQYQYLEAVRDVKKEFSSIETIVSENEDSLDWIKIVNPASEYLENLNKIKTSWLELYFSGSKISDFLLANKFSSICIYGFGELGEMLYRSLIQEKVEIKAILDKRITSTKYNVSVFNPDICIPECDLIIMTVINNADSIIDYLEEKTNTPVIPLSSLLYESTCYY